MDGVAARNIDRPGRGRSPGTGGSVRTIHLVHRDSARTAPGARTREPVPGPGSSQPVDRIPGRSGEGGAAVPAELPVPGPRT